MPAIQVAKTDTLEQQRQKINQIGTAIFGISAGGSDLSAGNLKLGDGTRTTPSLAFSSDDKLGIYKPDTKTIGYVSDGRKIADFAPSGLYTYKDFIIRQKTLSTSNISILDYGQNYDAGTYTGIAISGGSGDSALGTVVVTEYIGSITNSGVNYKKGSYTNVNLTGGSGTGANVDFDVSGIVGSITNAGSGYVPGTYTNVSLTGGSGSGSTATIQIDGSTTLNGSITASGTGYTTGSYSNVTVLNEPTTTYTVTAQTSPSKAYLINGVVQQVLTLVKGNTYKFDISSATLSTDQFQFTDSIGNNLDGRYYIINTIGSDGIAGSFISLVIKPTAPTETIKYGSRVTANMGANTSITTGTAKYYGHNAQASVVVNATGNISSFTFTSTGSDYKNADKLEIANTTVGGTGSGFKYTLTAPTYTGTVSSVSILNDGTGYLLNNVLSANVSDLGNFGSGFQYTISNNPGTITQSSFKFNSKGTGYQISNILSLPTTISGVSTNLKGEVTGISTTLSTSSTNITVTSTTGIVQGMNVFNGAGDIGQVAANTTVQNVVNATTITLSANPTVSGTASLTFRSPGSSIEISVASTDGIYSGYSVTKTSGTGVLNNNTTVQSVNSSTNTITLSAAPTTAGTAVLSFIPPYGSGTSFGYTISKLGVVSNFSIISGGNGYSIGDQLTLDSTILTQPITYAVTNKSVQIITFSTTLPTSTFTVGNTIKKRDGQIISTSTTSSTILAGQANITYTNIAATGGTGSAITFNITRGASGAISTITVNNSGYNYTVGDTLTIAGNLVGGALGTDNIVLSVQSVVTNTAATIYKINSSGGNITSVLIDAISLLDSDVIVKTTAVNTPYTVNTASAIRYRYFINTGSGATLTPNITLYVGSTYKFDLTDNSNTGHAFALSKYRDGIWSPSLIQNISTTLSTASPQITVASTTGILAGMSVTVTSGTGTLLSNTLVQSVDSATTLTLSIAPASSGAAVLSFAGVEYTTGVTKTSTSLTIKVTSDTPNLYYYCATGFSSHVDEGGDNNEEALLTVNSTNPKIFGSGFTASVLAVNSSDIIKAEISSGDFTANRFLGTSAVITNATISGILNAPSITGGTIQVSTITSTGQLSITSSSVSISNNLNIGAAVQIESSTGKITTGGIIKTTNSLNINDVITISNNTISSASGNNLVLSPATGRVAKVNTTTAITIPSGTTAQRPAAGVVENGSIRFNTDSGQYEGYNASTTSWSSLGGVRDLDGNTYIAAEASVGANDNTLYFYNDGNNTIKVTPTELVFNTVKSIDSTNTSNPANTPWIANTVVALNAYLSYGLNLYKVTTAGTTAGSANPPTHTTGTVVNGTAQLLWYANYADDITFDQVQNVVIRSNLLFKDGTNNELSLTKNTISTGTSDLVLQPLAGKKVTISAATSLVLPAGDSNSRGIAAQGSVRYNTTITQFEGYNGTNWTSLGGVKDVDGNTYIIPETSPGANENILYFYNNGSNTLRLSTTELTFNTIDQIGSTNNNLDLQAQTVTFNSLALTIDNSSTSTKFLSTKTNIDFALSVGLYTDPLIRLNTSGDIYINKTFGTGSNTLIKVLDNELKTFELDDVKIETAEYILTKGTTNSNASVIYDPTVYSGAKVVIVANNITADHREIFEFTVVSKGTDIFHTEYGNVTTGADVISAAFDFNAGGNVRLTSTLASAVANGNVVNVTVTSTLIKK